MLNLNEGLSDYHIYAAPGRLSAPVARHGDNFSVLLFDGHFLAVISYTTTVADILDYINCPLAFPNQAMQNIITSYQSNDTDMTWNWIY